MIFKDHNIQAANQKSIAAILAKRFAPDNTAVGVFFVAL
jgi:hypothetical protein